MRSKRQEPHLIEVLLRFTGIRGVGKYNMKGIPVLENEESSHVRSHGRAQRASLSSRRKIVPYPAGGSAGVSVLRKQKY